MGDFERLYNFPRFTRVTVVYLPDPRWIARRRLNDDLKQFERQTPPLSNFFFSIYI